MNENYRENERHVYFKNTFSKCENMTVIQKWKERKKNVQKD